MANAKKKKSLGLMVAAKDAERVRQKLLEIGLIDVTRLVSRQQDAVIFPLVRRPKKQELLSFDAQAKIGLFSFVLAKKKPRSLEDALAKILTKKELDELITSFDVIGDIAVIEIPKSLISKKRLIGNALLKAHPNIKTVARVCGEHRGRFRLRPVEIIAGERKTLAIHKESGCIFKVDIAKTYFSPRLSFERMRIAKQIKEGELIGAWFAGVGPFPIIFAKHSKMKKAVAIELNPHAYNLMVENIKLNKCEGKIEPILGDVKKIVPSLSEKFDRIVMPMPKGSESFLNEAFSAAKHGCVVHFYQFAPSEKPFGNACEQIKLAAKLHGKKVRILKKRIVRSVSASKVQVVIDFKIF